MTNMLLENKVLLLMVFVISVMVVAQAYCFVSAHPRYAKRLGLVDNRDDFPRVSRDSTTHRHSFCLV